MSPAPTDFRVSQSDPRIPTIAESEEVIRTKAPRALEFLKERGGLDLVDILGLTPYVEGSVHA